MSSAFSRVLVLASNSFTGSHFIDHLLGSTDAEVVGVSRSVEYDSVLLPYRYRKNVSARFTFYQLDVNRDLEEILNLADTFRPDLVVNFAAQGEVRNSWNWPEEWFETNCMSVVRFTSELGKRDYVKKYVSISTPEVYGNTGLDTVENETYRPSTPYAVSKLAGDLHVQSMFKRFGFPAVFTRSANLYGIHQQLYRIIPRSVIYLKLGKTLTLHGGGEAERAFIHARDVANATLLAAEHGGLGEVYHVAPEGELRSIASVVSLVCGMMGKKMEDAVEFVDENFGQDARFSMDAGKARRELAWRPNISFEAGLEEIIAWINDNWEVISTKCLDYVHIHN